MLDYTLVGTRGFEPPTSCTPCKRSTRLNYVPNDLSIYHVRIKCKKKLLIFALPDVKLTPVKTIMM